LEILDHIVNPFKGAVISPDRLPSAPQEFHERLARSLDAWRVDGLLLVWLEVPIERAGLIPVGVEKGFSFHHTGNDYLMLTLRLVEGALIPNYATHYIGAGGVVLNDRRELLVVCEKHRRSKRPSYKLPGGALHPGEHVADCVVREIEEETGVKTAFESLVCFRHWHGYRYGKSDIYFVCRLRPLSEKITIQDDEIDESLWMPVEDYLNSEYVHSFNQEVLKAALGSEGLVTASVEAYSDTGEREVFMPVCPQPDTSSD
jgi:8-oxo-dGTP diphosphatase